MQRRTPVDGAMSMFRSTRDCLRIRRRRVLTRIDRPVTVCAYARRRRALTRIDRHPRARMPRATRAHALWDVARSLRARVDAVLDAIARRRARRATTRDGDGDGAMRVVCLGGALGREMSAMVATAWTRKGAGRRAEVASCAVTATRRAMDAATEEEATLVFVVETAEGDEPAAEARAAVKMILREAKARNGDGAGDARGRRYATAMVGDCDIIGDRAAYRSNQSVVEDCNAVGLAVDAALRRFGWTRAAESLRVDKSKEDDDAWRRGRSAAVDAWVAKL